MNYTFEAKEKNGGIKKMNLMEWYKMVSDSMHSIYDRPLMNLIFVLQKYNINIVHKDQPIIISLPSARDVKRGDNKEKALVPELCIMTGVAPEIRANRTAMRGLAQFMKMSPDVRCKTLLEFNSSLCRNPKVNEIKMISFIFIIFLI